MSQLKHKGDTLIELLVSLVVFAFGMLGIAGMLLLANKSNSSSYAKQQAVQTVYDIFDRIRANSTAVASGNYNINNINTSGEPTIPPAPLPLCNAAPCTSEQLAAYDTWLWLSKNVTKLPRGSGSITTASFGSAGNTLVTVTVQWDDSPAQSKLGAISTTSTANPNWVRLSIQSIL